MRALLFFILIFFHSAASASIQDLVAEYLENNLQVLKSRALADTSFLNIASVEAQRVWSLSYSGSKEKDNLEQLSPFSLRDTSSTVHALSIGKGFNWGGEFSLNNTLSSFNTPSFIQESNGLTQGLKYTQDLGANFFGRSFYSELKTASKTHASKEAEVSHNIQSSLLAFVSVYSEAKLNLALLELQKAAEKRAKRRKNLIQKRVRDGLKERVDLIQARIELLSIREQVKTAQMKKEVSLESLSKALHRDVSRKEIDGFNVNKVPSGNVLQNLEIISLERKVEALKLAKEQVDYSFWPTLNAAIEYNVNDYNNDLSTAISDGNLLGDRDASETVLSLNAIWSFGNEGQAIARTKNNIELRAAEMERDKLKINFSKSEKSLRKQLKLLGDNLSSVKSRKKLAKKALKEMTKLYNRGRADLDQVIRAEESLINTQRSYVLYLNQREGLIYKLSTLYGTLQEYLLR